MSMALMIEAHLGNQPWDVFHQGLAGADRAVDRRGHRRGRVVVLLLLAAAAASAARPRHGVQCGSSSGSRVTWRWPPCRPRPPVAAPSPSWSPASSSAPSRPGCTSAPGSAPGPRDGPTTGLAARGHSIRNCRSGIEIRVVAMGFMLGISHPHCRLRRRYRPARPRVHPAVHRRADRATHATRPPSRPHSSKFEEHS